MPHRSVPPHRLHYPSSSSQYMSDPTVAGPTGTVTPHLAHLHRRGVEGDLVRQVAPGTAPYLPRASREAAEHEQEQDQKQDHVETKAPSPSRQRDSGCGESVVHQHLVVVRHI